MLSILFHFWILWALRGQPEPSPEPHHYRAICRGTEVRPGCGSTVWLATWHHLEPRERFYCPREPYSGCGRVVQFQVTPLERMHK